MKAYIKDPSYFTPLGQMSSLIQNFLMDQQRQPLVRNATFYQKHKKKIITSVVVIVAVVGIFILFTSFGISAYAANNIATNPIFATYERIGHDECPGAPGTTLIYEGFTAGFSTMTGSTSFKCLPIQEEHISYFADTDAKYTNTSEIRFVNATEYRTFKGGNSINNHDAYCAVCHVSGRDTIQVIPATDQCTDNSWTKEYDGYLMTDNSATTFTCVDKNMETIPNTGTPVDNAPVLRHIVVPSDLGKNINNEYDSTKVLSCVVCSK